jgi:hypothetical protein
MTPMRVFKRPLMVSVQLSLITTVWLSTASRQERLPNPFFDEMRQDIHSVSPHPGFSTLTEFVPRNKNQLPQLGDIIDIKIPGDNGSVMLVDNQKNYFTFNTITNLSPFDKHPESGAREFGYEQNSDGSTTLYTRGVSRPYDQVTRYGGAGPQQATWAFFHEGREQPPCRTRRRRTPRFFLMRGRSFMI